MTQKLYCFNFYSDPGHGWLKVPREFLIQLGIQFKVSNYSYQRGIYVWLEEDCDAPLLLKSVEASGGKVEIINHHTNDNSRIRTFEPYDSQTKIKE